MWERVRKRKCNCMSAHCNENVMALSEVKGHSLRIVQ